MMRPLPVLLAEYDAQLERDLSAARRRAELRGCPDRAAYFAEQVAILRRRRLHAEVVA